MRTVMNMRDKGTAAAFGHQLIMANTEKINPRMSAYQSTVHFMSAIVALNDSGTFPAIKHSGLVEALDRALFGQTMGITTTPATGKIRL